MLKSWNCRTGLVTIFLSCDSPTGFKSDWIRLLECSHVGNARIGPGDAGIAYVI